LKEIIIDIGDSTRNELRWLAFYRSLESKSIKKGKQVIIDFENVTFIIPFCLLGLLAFIKSTFEITQKKVKLINISSDKTIYQYMERVDFFKYTKKYCTIIGDYTDVKLWERDNEAKKVHGIIEVEKDPNKSAKKVALIIDDLQNRYKHILDFFSTNHKNANIFFTILSEITANIPDHSNSNGYLLIQRWESQAKGKIFTSLSIIDTGIGIRRSLQKQIKTRNRKLPKNLDGDSDFLRYAFSEEGTRSGAGLHSVVRSLHEWNANDTALLVLSGSGIMYKPQGSCDITFIEEEHYFQGTHATIWFYGDI